MSNETIKPTGKSKGLVYGMAVRGSYNSSFFKIDDLAAKARAIYHLLEDCGSTITAAELCAGTCAHTYETCLPGTLQSAGNDDADLNLMGPDANGNYYYNLVITGKGVVGWSAVENSCICTVI